MSEISCRITNTFIQYVRNTRPELLAPLLRGLPFDEQHLMDPDQWIDWDTERVLEERLASLYDDEMIMFKIGQSIMTNKSLGIVNILFNLFMTPERLIRYTPRIARYFTRDVVHINVLETTRESATVELKIKGKQTRGSCLYNQGMYSTATELFGLDTARISEVQCVVPVHEAGRINGKSYSVDNEKIVREFSFHGDRGNIVAPLSDTGTFELNGTSYGAGSCVYQLRWENRLRGFFRKTARKKKALSDAMEHLEHNHRKLQKAYDQLWKSEEKYRSLMENASDIICIIDTDGVITSMNKKGVELSGYSSAEIIGQPFLHFVHEEYRNKARARFRKSLRDSTGPFEFIAITKDSGRLVLSANSSIIRESGSAVGLMIIARDITREREIAARLLEAERFAAKGIVAAEIAHEINNSLANMETALFIVNNIRTDTRYRQDIFHDIFEEIERMSGIVKGILEVYRSDHAVIRPVDINREISKVITMTKRRLYGKVISLSAELSPDIPSIPCYPGHIKQILLNLIKNAEEAMSSSSRKVITIRTIEDNGTVMLDVEDTGCGVPRGSEEKVFTQMYSSKSDGSGIGLPICREIVSRYNGQITIKNNVKTGTTVRVSFPTRYHA